MKTTSISFITHAAVWLLATTGTNALASPAAASGPTAILSAGAETSVVVPGVESAIKVFLPTNYVAGTKWPAILCYPPMNHGPNTSMLRVFTRSRDYILVGLPYVSDSPSQATAQAQAAALQQERAGFRAALGWLTANATVDDQRIFLAGISKGGWMTASLGERELSRLAGLVIILSGRIPYAGQQDLANLLRGKPIYLGAGEADPNLIPALQAREYYRRNGANVTFEMFDGVGHAMPEKADRLTAWLEARGRYGSVGGAAELAELKEACRSKAVRINAEKDPAAKYAQLTDVAQNPLMALCFPASIPGIEPQLAALRAQLPAQKAEWQAEQSFSEILWREMNLRRVDDQRRVRDDLKMLSETYPGAKFGRLAADLCVKVAEAYEKSVAATKQAAAAQKPATSAAPRTVTPSFPGIDTSPRPPIMKQKGKTLTFQ